MPFWADDDADVTWYQRRFQGRQGRRGKGRRNGKRKGKGTGGKRFFSLRKGKAEDKEE